MLRVVAILCTLVASVTAAAHTGQPVMPPPSRFLDQVRFWNNIGDLLEEFEKRFLNDAASRATVKNDLVTNEQRLVSKLRWSGEAGYLLKVRIQKHIITQQKLLVGEPVQIGLGDTPENVLAGYIRSDRFEAAPISSPTMKESPEDSFYVWARLKKDASGSKDPLSWGVIPTPFTIALEQEALKIFSHKAFYDALKEEQRGRVMAAAVETLKQRSEDAAAKQAYDKVLVEIRETRAKIQQIDRDLNRALEQAARAASLAADINKLSKVVGLATLIAQVQNSLTDVDPKQFDVAAPGRLIQKVNDYKASKDGVVLRYREELTIIVPEASKKWDELRRKLFEAGAPDDVLRSIDPPVRLRP